MNKNFVLFAIAILACSGCTYGGIYAQHISHPLVGRPFTSAQDDDGRYREGGVNAIGIELRRDMGRFSLSQSMSYDFASGCEACMRGGPVLYEGKISLRIFGTQ